jgi:outer membrane biosynthesis protein TonB
LAIESTHPAFAREAEDAVRRWRISPHQHEGSDCHCAHGLRFAFHAGGVVSLAAMPQRRGTDDTQTAGAARTASLAYNMDELDVAPNALAQPLPALAKKSSDEPKPGAVNVTFFIDQKGRVRVPSIVSPVEAGVATAVLAALTQWRYDAPRKGGRAVAAMNEVAFSSEGAAKAKTFAVVRDLSDNRAH